MCHDPGLSIVQNHMEKVVNRRAHTLPGQICADRVRPSEQKEDLVKQMRPEVIEDSGSRPVPLAPALFDLGDVAVEVKRAIIDLAQRAISEHFAGGHKAPVPAAVLEGDRKFSHFISQF